MIKILLLEDDFKVASEVKTFLESEGFDCEATYDGLIFLKAVRKEHFDIYLLDVNVPSLNGLAVCRTVRETDRHTPILMLTAYGAVNDKVEALNLGADDYLVKPFHLDELAARIRALTRRAPQAANAGKGIIRVADLAIHTEEMKVFRAGREISLTPKEYRLLELLARQAGRTVSKQTIAERVWDQHFETGGNTIEVYISFLRTKIDKGQSLPLIHTRPGYGYYLRENK